MTRPHKTTSCKGTATPHVVADPCDFALLLETSRGKPFVFSEGDSRSLHFEEKYVQSEMRITAPYELALSYTRVMMDFREYISTPRHILMIGLGGGSLAKYCYRNLPSTRITVVEIDADVIALRDEFMIPADDERFQVIHADGAQYIEQAAQDVDVLLLDGFNATGQAVELGSIRFYSACRRVLTSIGMLVVNLSGDDANLTYPTIRLRAAFEERTWQRPVPDSNNRIAFALKRPASLRRARTRS
jgi:spermidine synthase